jgi:hypothetical protein
MAKDNLGRWLKWVKNIEEDVTLLVKSREIYNDVHAIISKNSKIQKPSYFYSFLHYTYFETALHKIRKQVIINDERASMLKLLEDIASHPESATKHAVTDAIKHKYAAVSSDFSAHMINNINKHYPLNLDKLSDKELIQKTAQSDLKNLKSKVDKCEQFAAKWLLHYNYEQENFTTIRKFTEVDECIDLLRDLYRRYSMILSGSSADFLSLENKLGWQMVFREPWIP